MMDKINREIHTQEIVNLLNSYISYSKCTYLSGNEQNSILRFIIYLMQREEFNG